MAAVIPALKVAGAWLGAHSGAVAAGSAAVGAGASLLAAKRAKGPAQIRAAEPTLDDAARRTDELDRIKQRRGVLANIFSRSSAPAPSVGSKTLLGQ